MAVQVEHWRFTVAQYERMGETGILHEDDRAELIDGEIVKMPPIGGPHMNCVNRLTMILALHVQRSAVVSVQNPVRLNNHSEPQPDVVVLRPGLTATVPTPADVVLLIEVSDTTLRYDRTVKVPMYARAGIAEVWVVDLAGASVTVYNQPQEGKYTQVVTVGLGASVPSLPDLNVTVDELVG